MFQEIASNRLKFYSHNSLKFLEVLITLDDSVLIFKGFKIQFKKIKINSAYNMRLKCRKVRKLLPVQS